jgi:hypothetical protein
LLTAIISELGSAKTFALMGKAFAGAMVELRRIKKTKP